MRKIHYHIAVTLDGYICHEDGSIDGFLMEGDHANEFIQSLDNYDTVLMGSQTYSFAFQYGLEPGQPAYPTLKHYIFSQSLDFESSDTVTLIKDNALQTIQTLKQEEGKDIWLCGGGVLAGYLLKHRMIDGLFLKVNPIVFGTGRKLFAGSSQLNNFKFESSKAYNNGVVLNHYTLL